MKKYLVIIFLCMLQGVIAQVEFKATPSSTKVGVNEYLRVEFSMNQDGDNFSPPTFKGFVASGQGQMINNSWINGVRSYSKTYTYRLTPTAKGTFTVGQATIEIGGQTYKTMPFKIVVGNAVANPNPQPARYNPFDPFGQQQRQQQQQGAMPTAQNPNEGIHLVAEVTNPAPYVNEPTTVIYKLYVGPNSDVAGFSGTEMPKYNNFWSQVQRVESKDMKVQPGTYQGQPYQYIELMRTVLYPQKNGKLEIEPLTLDVNVRVASGPRDFFGRQPVTVVKTSVTTGKKIINVKALPEAGKPDSFTGAVGSFDFKVQPTRTTLKGGESMQLTVSVSGKGNLKLFTLPKPVVPSSLEMYDPEHKENVKTPITGMVGGISDTYTIVPNNKGKYPVKAMEFSWFDPAAGKYKTANADEIMVNVLTAPASNAVANRPQSQKKQLEAGQSFRFVALKTSVGPMGREDFLGSDLFYALLFVPFAFIPVIVLAKRKKEAYDSDVVGNKVRTTNKLARKFLGDAKKQLGNKEPFYLALEKALHNFLKSKLRIETAELSRDNIQELLLSRNAKPDTVNDFTKIMDSCEFARYAPASEGAMQQDYESAVSVITSLEKQVS